MCVSYLAMYIFSDTDEYFVYHVSATYIYSPIEQVKKSAIGETIFPPDKNFLIPQLREDRGSKYKYEYKYKYKYEYKY